MATQSKGKTMATTTQSKAKKRTRKNVNPQALTAHPANAAIYGTLDEKNEEDAEFLESIEEHGVEVPIIVAADETTIVSGHRRWQSSLLIGLSKVPVEIAHELTDPDEIELALLRCNAQRIKAVACRALEFGRIEAINKKLAAKRMKAGKADDKAGPKGRAADQAAAAAGFGSRTTAKKALELAEKLTTMKKEGHPAAKDLEAALAKSNGAIGPLHDKFVKGVEKDAKPSESSESSKSKGKKSAETLPPGEADTMRKNALAKCIAAVKTLAKHTPQDMRSDVKEYLSILLKKYETA